MASNNKSEKDPPAALIEQFCAVTGADKTTAASMLTACNNNLELAVGMQLDGGGAMPGPAPSTSTEEAPVRAPIPQVQEKLVEDYTQYGFRGRRRGATRSVFDGFRNFEAEMRQQERERQGVAATPESNNANIRKRKTLEELFKPPLDIMYKGSFNTAKGQGASSNKWLLVNIQNSKEFPCQVLNRDIWSNQTVKTIVNEHFVFWQVYHDSEEGLQYMRFYDIKEWPYVAIIDPITGENMVVWNKLDCNTFCELVTGFLSLHPSLDGTSSPPHKKARLEDSILDASEESQLQEAMRNSVEEVRARAGPILPELTDDDSLSENDELETFSDSDGGDQSVSNTPVKKSGMQSGKKDSSQNGGKIDPAKKTAESGDSVMEKQSRVLNSKCAGLIDSERDSEPATEENSKSAKEDTPSGESKWKTYLGDSDDPESKLQIRFPDGKKEQLNIPCSSKLMAVVQYVIESGFSNERYELVTNYPRRKLSYLDFEASIKSIGLFPQDTIFVQER